MKKNKKQKFYICSTDFHHELEMIPTTVYPSLKSIKKHKLCVTGPWNQYPCGIYEIEITFKRVVKKGRV